MNTIREGLQIYRNRPANARWKIPAFCCNDWAAVRLLQICSEITDKQPFDVVYGAPRCSWAGGRPSAINEHMSEDELHRYFSTYRSLGVTSALTLSRLEVSKEDLADPYGNLLLDLLEEYDGEAIVFDDKLAHYIHRTHPSIKVIGSLNKAMCDFEDDFSHHTEETDYYLRLLELYDEIVIRCEYALDPEKLISLSDVKDKVEIIVNQFCEPSCQNAYRHLKSIDEWNHGGQQGACQQCFYLGVAGNMTHRLSNNLFMSDEYINTLCSLGFTRLKLAGRNSLLPQFIDMLAKYLFEPTGIISIVRNEVMREFRIQATQFNPSLQQFHLPDQDATVFAS